MDNDQKKTIQRAVDLAGKRSEATTAHAPYASQTQGAREERQEMIKKYKQCEVTIHAHYTITLEPDEVAQYEEGTPITEFDGWNDELVHIEVYDIKPTDAVCDVEKSFDDLTDLVERADAGDKQAKKLLRSGKYAFPHLREFGKLPDLKGETLIDNFISVLTTNPKHLYANYKNKENQRTMKQMAVVLKRAHRFKVDDDLLERVLFESAPAKWEKIFDVINNAVPPFNNMWIETERNSRLFERWRNDATHFAPEWVGWHIQRAGAVRTYPKEGANFLTVL